MANLSFASGTVRIVSQSAQTVDALIAGIEKLSKDWHYGIWLDHIGDMQEHDGSYQRLCSFTGAGRWDLERTLRSLLPAEDLANVLDTDQLSAPAQLFFDYTDEDDSMGWMVQESAIVEVVAGQDSELTELQSIDLEKSTVLMKQLGRESYIDTTDEGVAELFSFLGETFPNKPVRDLLSEEQVRAWMEEYDFDGYDAEGLLWGGLELGESILEALGEKTEAQKLEELKQELGLVAV